MAIVVGGLAGRCAGWAPSLDKPDVQVSRRESLQIIDGAPGDLYVTQDPGRRCSSSHFSAHRCSPVAVLLLISVRSTVLFYPDQPHPKQSTDDTYVVSRSSFRGVFLR
jgi:hypothetical protein